MPRRRISMRKLLEILRLKASGLSDRQVASSVSIARSTVAEYLRRLEEAGLSWPFAEEIGEEELERRLFDGPPSLQGTRQPFRPPSRIYGRCLEEWGLL